LDCRSCRCAGNRAPREGKLDEAIAILQKHVTAKPDALDAYSILRQLYWRKQDLPAHLEATIKVCQLHLKAQDADAAWEDFQDYGNAGEARMPAATWLELCRMAEGHQDFQHAVTEYENLAKTYPTEKQSLLSLLSAGRLCLKKLNRPADALLYYKAAKAQASKVPHLDWDSNIQTGIPESEKLIGASAIPVENA
jgi:tetratricopeptide (TPR) repeat protein